MFVGHSQGSIIVIDYLQEKFPFESPMCRERPHVISLGSPLATIYQRYFKEYRAIFDGVGSRLGLWVNFYRVDDYVGGPISTSNCNAVENVPLRAGGHMNYWAEPRVAVILRDTIAGVRTSEEAPAASTVG